MRLENLGLRDRYRDPVEDPQKAIQSDWDWCVRRFIDWSTNHAGFVPAQIEWPHRCKQIQQGAWLFSTL